VMVVPVTVAVAVTATVQLGVLDQIQFSLGQVWIQATELTCRAADRTGHAIELAGVLLDAGADIVARDDEVRSTALARVACMPFSCVLA
jgi:hypothetical protein